MVCGFQKVVNIQIVIRVLNLHQINSKDLLNLVSKIFQIVPKFLFLSFQNLINFLRLVSFQAVLILVILY